MITSNVKFFVKLSQQIRHTAVTNWSVASQPCHIAACPPPLIELFTSISNTAVHRCAERCGLFPRVTAALDVLCHATASPIYSKLGPW